MSQPMLPASQTAIASLALNEWIDLGSDLPMSFDGNHSFTIATWLRIREFCPNGIIFQKENEFSFGIQGTALTARMAGQLGSVTTQKVLTNHTWYYVVVTFASDGNKAGVITIYINGVSAGQGHVSNVGTTNQGKPFEFGRDLNADFWSMSLWSVVMEPSNPAIGMWQNPVVGTTGLISNYQFSKVPANDTSGNNNPIHYIGGANQDIATPGVHLTDTAYCEALRDDEVNPGGAGNDAYTIQAWVYLEKRPAQQVVLSNGNLGETNGIALLLDYDSENDEFIAHSIRGDGSGEGANANVAATTSVNLNEWVNVATTYDGTTLTIYINGQAVGSVAAGTIPALSEARVLLGASYDIGADSGQTGFLQGFIQQVAIWTTAISTEDIQQYMYDEPIFVEGCDAIYAFDVPPARNLINGSSMSLIDGAAIDHLHITPIADDDIQEQYAAGTAAQMKRAERMDALAMKKVDDYDVKLKPVTISDERRTAILDDLESWFPPEMGKEERSKLLGQFEADMDRALSSEKPLKNYLTHARDGDEWVIYYHDGEDAYEAVRLSALDNDECVIWGIELVGLVIFSVLEVIGVPVLKNVVMGALTRIINRDRRILLAAVSVLVTEVTAMTIIQASKGLYDTGYLKTFLKDIWSGLSWWDVLFLVAGVISELVELFFPNPSTAAWVALKLTQLGLAVGQVILKISERPADCFSDMIPEQSKTL